MPSPFLIPCPYQENDLAWLRPFLQRLWGWTLSKVHIIRAEISHLFLLQGQKVFATVEPYKICTSCVRHIQFVSLTGAERVTRPSRTPWTTKFYSGKPFRLHLWLYSLHRCLILFIQFFCQGSLSL